MTTPVIRAALERLLCLLEPFDTSTLALGDAITDALDALATEPPDPAGGGEALLAAAPKEKPSDEEIRQCSSVVELAHVIQGAFPLASLDAERIARAVLTRWCHAAAPAAPADGEVGELVAWLNNHAAHLRTMEGIGALPKTELQERLDRAATLLQRQAAELAALRTGVMPVPVSERPWEREGWCDEQGRCWMGDPGGGWFIPSWRLCRPEDVPNMKVSLPFHAIPLPAPQAGEVE